MDGGGVAASSRTRRDALLNTQGWRLLIFYRLIGQYGEYWARQDSM